MKRIFYLSSLIVLVLTGCGKSPAGGPVNLDKTAAEAVIKEIEKDRAETREWLRSNPRSYLAAVDRIDFGEKSALTVGRADDNDVRLSADDIEPHHLKITVDGDRFRVEAIDAKAGFKVKDEVKARRDARSVDYSRSGASICASRISAIRRSSSSILRARG